RHSFTVIDAAIATGGLARNRLIIVKMLFLSRWFPEPADNGAKSRVLNVLRQLAVDHEISLVSFNDQSDEGGGRETSGQRHREIDRLCQQVVAVPYRRFEPASVNALLGLVSRQPRFLVDTRSRPMDGAVASVFRQCEPDIVLASQIDMIPYV